MTKNLPASPARTAGSYGLADYVGDVERVLDRMPSTPLKVKEISALTTRLSQDGSWLAPEFRASRADCYARHLLHRDRQNRFVVLSLVWLPGQGTPIHDHSCWGVMGILEGSLEEVAYERLDDGTRAGHAELSEIGGHQVHARSTSYLLPPYREIHRIGNNTNAPTVSLHIYGRDIDEVNVFDLVTKKVSPMRIKYYNPATGGCDFAI